MYNSAMQIPDDALDEFIQIYKKEFKEELTKTEASEMASRLLTLYELLARKLPNEKVSPPKPHGDNDASHSKMGLRA